MRTDTLRENQLSDDAYEWYLAYLARLDARDINRYAAYLADDISIRFNNGDPVVGKKAVTEMLGGYWQSFAGLEHVLRNIYGTDHRFVLEADNVYQTHDGREATTRAVAFTDRNEDGLVTSIRISADMSPVFGGATA